MNDLIDYLVSGLSGAWGGSVSLEPVQVVLALFYSALLSGYLYVVYMSITKKAFYSKNFNITLVGISLITTSLVLTIQSSLLVSLSVGGALSIVRFRTAIKSPIDTMFLFWSIATGIMCGTGVAVYAFILSAVLSIVIIVLINVSFLKKSQIIVINATDSYNEDIVIDAIKKICSFYEIKSRNIGKKEACITMEIRTKNEQDLLKVLKELDFIDSVSLLNFEDTI